MNDLLKNISILRGLNEKALEMFLRQVEPKTFPAGTILAREGDTDHFMYLIGSGSVRIVKKLGQPGEVELAVLKGKDFFGEMCILEPLPRCASVQAIEPTTTFSVSSTAFYRLFEKMPEQYGLLLLNIARDLSRRLRYLDEIYAARK